MMMLHPLRTHTHRASAPCRTAPAPGRRRGAAAAAVGTPAQVAFPNDRGETLVGTLLLPETSEGAAAGASGGAAARPNASGGRPPCVILAHGYMSSRDSELLVRLATALARDGGFASLRFDFSGNGASKGRFRYGGYRSEAEEIRCAREWAQAQGLAVAGLVGHSKGATTALLYASKYADIPRVVNLAGRFDVRQGVEQRLGSRVLRQLRKTGEVEMKGRSRARGEFSWRLTEADLQDRLSTDVAAACAALPPSVRVLTVHGTDDANVPVGEASKFAAAIASHESLILEGVDHSFSSLKAMLQLAPAVTSFLQSGL